MNDLSTKNIELDSTSTGDLTLPKFPGETPLRHEAQEWLETAEAKLAARGLLAVANGGEPAATRQIVDVPLDALPELPADHRDYERRLETRIRMQIENQKNKEKRFQLTMAAWTQIYTALKICTQKTAPMLSRELLELCDLSTDGMADGYFDGPRAWRIICGRLAGEERTKQDKEYYRTAEALQRSKPLADGCSAGDYSKRAMAYLVHIKPNLPYTSSASDAAEYLVDLLPKCLKAMGKQLKYELKTEGRWEDLMYVAKRCRELVFEDQRGATYQTSLMVAISELNGFDTTAMACTTGMPLTTPNTHNKGWGTMSKDNVAYAGAEVKWCKDCPHPNNMQCFCNPSWRGVVPPSVFLNKERLAGIKKARERNAAEHGVPCEEMSAPSPTQIEKHKKRIEERKARKPKRDKSGATPGGAAAPAASISDFFDNLVDLTEGAGAFVEVTSAHVVGNDESDGDDDEEGPAMIWYVLVPTAYCLPELQCVTDPAHLYCDPSTHSPVGFGSDEGAARTYFQQEMVKYSNYADQACSSAGAEPVSERRTFGNVPLGEQARSAEKEEGTEHARAGGTTPSDTRVARQGSTEPGSTDRSYGNVPLSVQEGRGADQPASHAEGALSRARNTALSSPNGRTPLPATSQPLPTNCRATREVPGAKPAGAVVITVPHAFRRLAKSHGARWDPHRREWWLPPGSDARALEDMIRRAAGKDGSARPIQAEAEADRQRQDRPVSSPRATRAGRPDAPTPLPIGLNTPLPLPPSPRPSPPVSDTQRRGPPAHAGEPTTSEERRQRRTTVAMMGLAVGLTLICAGVSITMTAAFTAVAVGGPTWLRDARQGYERVGAELMNMAARTCAFIEDNAGQIIVTLILVALAQRGAALSYTRGTSYSTKLPGTQHGVTRWHTGLPIETALPATEPRADLLTHEEAAQLHCELLAGHDVPSEIPDSIARALCLADSGCGRSMGNHRDQFESGSIRPKVSSVAGAAGTFQTRECGKLRMPLETKSHGVRAFREEGAILNPSCAYVLLSVGRASIEHGVAMYMARWGEPGEMIYPNGVAIELHNRHVLVLRPLGYRASPIKPLAMVGAEDLGAPSEGEYVLYICSGPYRPTDLGQQMSKLGGDVSIVMIDIQVGGKSHDILRRPVANALVNAAKDERCKGVVVTPQCRTWSVATIMPDSQGRQGQPYRDIDHIYGVRRADGSLPPAVVDANVEAEHLVEICMAVISHDGFALVEQPARRREGSTAVRADHVLKGCERAAHMFDHPGWKQVARKGNAREVVWDQCMLADHPKVAARKSSVWLATERIALPIEAHFGNLHCNHGAGTHPHLTGQDEDGVWVTKALSTETFSAGTNRLLARCILAAVHGEAAYVVGVIQGRYLAKHAVSHDFIHQSFNHAEARVLRHLHHTLSDVPEWWAEQIREQPCDACLRANAPRLPGRGQLPQDDGLYYMDTWHVTTPEIFTGRKLSLGVVHSTTMVRKTVRMLRKSDAPAALEIITAFFNSKGKPIRWLHTDGAGELKGTGLLSTAQRGQVRVTTTTTNSSRSNRQEPQWRVMAAQARSALAQSRLPYSFYGWAIDHVEEGANLLPSRDAPHLCPLERLQGSKPAGSHRRPFGCLCYLADAARLPSGTLVNKMAEQGVRAIHLGYGGGESGSFEALGRRAQSGYYCYVPDGRGRGRIVCSQHVRFVTPAVYPGLQRTSGGGWVIPTSRIPFHEDFQHTQDEEDTGQMPSSDVLDLRTEEDIPYSRTDTDDNQGLEFHPGFPDEDGNEESEHLEAEDAVHVPKQGSIEPPDETETDEADNEGADQVDKATERMIVPAQMWPDYECHENNGRGWSVEVLRRKGRFSRVRFKGDYANEWVETSRLIPEIASDATHPPCASRPGITDHLSAQPERDATTESSDQQIHEQNGSKEERPEEGGYDSGQEIIPNHNTIPPPGLTDPYKDPQRPVRERAPTERYQPGAYSLIGMPGMSNDGWKHGYDPKSPRMPLTALVVEPIREQEKDVGKSIEAGGGAMEGGLLSSLYDDCYAAAEEFGPTSPPTIMAREVYAACNVTEASTTGHSSPLDPTFCALFQPGCPYDVHALFDPGNSGRFHVLDTALAAKKLGKKKSSPDDYNERQMRGQEWDTPKQMEIAKIRQLQAMTPVAADDPTVKGMPVCETMWAGRAKRDGQGEIRKYNARCVCRGDLQKKFYKLTSNHTFSPTIRNSSLLCVEAAACMRRMHMRTFDVPGAYLQGEQTASERMLLRPPMGFRTVDERGVEILWLMNSPLYGQGDAGAIWNRTINAFLVDELGFKRSVNDPCVYTMLDGEVILPLYVDDGRLYYTDDKRAQVAVNRVMTKLTERFGIQFGPEDPEEDYFLGGNRVTNSDRSVVTVRMKSYIELTVKRYLGDKDPLDRFPTSWGQCPADDNLTKDWENVMVERPAATNEVKARYGSLFGSLLHATKYRPEIAATMSLLGSCLTFPNEVMYRHLERVLVYLGRTASLGITFSVHQKGEGLRCYADSNWSITRSTSGYVIILCGGTISANSHRQHCITMSSTEAELVALADCAIELLYILGVLEDLGVEIPRPVDVCTDNKGAYDLCHRFTSAQNSRHVDRKMFKMRELRGAGTVTVRHIPTEQNPADLFTKVLSKSTFEKHRRTVLNNGVHWAPTASAGGGSSDRDQTRIP